MTDELTSDILTAGITGSNEAILIVDDEEMQRMFLTELLTTLKYNATAVASGEEAVNFLQNHQVSLVLLDMCMSPGMMNGRQTYESILKLHPGQRAIVVSGYAESEEIKKTIDLGAREFVRKPYTLQILGLAIKNGLLD